MKISWNDDYCAKKYDELMDKQPEDLTEKEKDFVTTMYHLEEYYAGLG